MISRQIKMTIRRCYHEDEISGSLNLAFSFDHAPLSRDHHRLRRRGGDGDQCGQAGADPRIGGFFFRSIPERRTVVHNRSFQTEEHAYSVFFCLGLPPQKAASILR